MIRTRWLAAAAKRGAIALAVGDGCQQIDAGKAVECSRHGQQFRLGKWIGGAAAKRKPSDPGGLRGMGDDDDAVGHHGVIARFGAVPFQHGEFGQMQIAALAVAKHPRKLENLLLAGGQQFLGGEFRRRPQIPRGARPVGVDKFGARRMQMGLVAGGNLQNSGFDLGKTLLVEPCPDGPGDGAARGQKWPDVGVPRGGPPRRSPDRFRPSAGRPARP